ncbi:hypothetical protein BDR04DRAFT_1003978 [Suillus decipiens]|nr:hypothetical protein BDR04DRAFT_1003978 [Suillus decipiens]
MNRVNVSTGFSPFQLHLGRSPHMLPPLTTIETPTTLGAEEECATSLLSQLKYDIMEAQDNLLAAKAAQATQVNKNCTPAITFQTGDRVLLTTKHR